MLIASFSLIISLHLGKGENYSQLRLYIPISRLRYYNKVPLPWVQRCSINMIMMASFNATIEALGPFGRTHVMITY